MELRPVNNANHEQLSTASPTYSVMTPVYNGEAFIPRCYAVLREQTFTDWEWVVVDDGRAALAVLRFARAKTKPDTKPLFCARRPPL